MVIGGGGGRQHPPLHNTATAAQRGVDMTGKKVINIDEISQELFPPIAVVLGGVEYALKTVTEDDMIAFSKVQVEGEDKVKAAVLLARLVEADEDTFITTDFRVVSTALKSIIDEFTTQLQAATGGNAEAGRVG